MLKSKPALNSSRVSSVVDKDYLPLNITIYLKATSSINTLKEPSNKTIDKDIKPSINAKEQEIEIDVS